MATRSTKTTTKTTKAKATSVKAAPKTATKTKIAKATAAKPVAAPKATVVEGMKPVVAGVTVKKPELIDRVMAETGMKKKDVKPVVEAMLTVLGRALSEGEELIVPPLGKVMVKRLKELPNARVMNVKVRHPLKTGLKPSHAEAAE